MRTEKNNNKQLLKGICELYGILIFMFFFFSVHRLSLIIAVKPEENYLKLKGWTLFRYCTDLVSVHNLHVTQVLWKPWDSARANRSEQSAPSFIRASSLLAAGSRPSQRATGCVTLDTSLSTCSTTSGLPRWALPLTLLPWSTQS